VCGQFCLLSELSYPDPLTNISTYLLLAEFEVPTVSYGPNFVGSIFGPKRSARAINRAEKRGSVIYRWTENTRLIRYLLYLFNLRKGKHFKSKVEQVHFTHVCQGIETRQFHWLLKIVARLSSTCTGVAE